MEEALRALIATNGDVMALVPERSILWEERHGVPGISLFVITGPVSDQTMDGPSGLLVSTVQIDCTGSTPAEAGLIQRTVRRLVDGHTGPVLHLVTVEGGGTDNNMGEGPYDGAKPAKFHTRRMDLRVRHYDP